MSEQDPSKAALIAEIMETAKSIDAKVADAREFGAGMLSDLEAAKAEAIALRERELAERAEDKATIDRLTKERDDAFASRDRWIQKLSDGMTDAYQRGLVQGHAGTKDDTARDFASAARPLVRWMNSLHPHHTALVTATGAELVMGVRNFVCHDYLRDKAPEGAAIERLKEET